MLTLSRYLYYIDEVKITFLDNLLKKRNLNECYFWIDEFYSSGYKKETWYLLYKIYYDFYALKNPSLEKNIIKEHNKWKKKESISFVLGVVKNLWRSSKDYEIFILRVYYCDRNIDILDSKDDEIINKYDYLKKNEKNLMKAIIQKKNICISYFLKKMIDSDNLIPILENILKKKTNINKNYSHLYHQILFKIIKNFIDKSHNKKTIYKLAKISETKNIILNNDDCYKGRLENVNYVWTTLTQKRLYSISSDIGCFKLDRYNDNIDIKEKFWYNWEYYAYNSPLWKERFNTYKININNEKELIEFTDDDEFEEFYEKFGYEPDEQSKLVQDKSLIKIQNITLKKWVNNIFEKKIKKNIRLKIIY